MTKHTLEPSEVKFQGSVDVHNIGGEFILCVRLGGSNFGLPLTQVLAARDLLAAAKLALTLIEADYKISHKNLAQAVALRAAIQKATAQ